MKLNPLIQKVIDSDSLFEDFTQWATAANGNWVHLLDMKEHVSIELRVNEEEQVMAKPSFQILGFSGSVEGMELCMPNEHLHNVIMQLLTIKEFLPKDENINEHTHKVFSRWCTESREKREKELAYIYEDLASKYKTLDSILALAAIYGMDPKDKELRTILKSVARKIRANQQEN